MNTYKLIIRVLSQEEKTNDNSQTSGIAGGGVVVFVLGMIIYCIWKCFQKKREDEQQAEVIPSNEYQFQEQNIEFEARTQAGRIIDEMKTSKQKLYLENKELEDCPICLMPISPALLISTSCNHQFHKACLTQWLEVNDMCPTCRTKVSK
ncbi:unnamed protein product [Paramecium sonneborni]|uniref:RING-type domain-containing protein n=1 Tax=Paramecium sonneborni TaxID=65129 RepID=A0A8S1QTA5_9CILI|nr:unnamed protein product [Paramecium sonneborni]